ncbi:methyl-accepting chemotaxis protein [Actinoplanes italicus]|uniref:Methyl-accepting chemotaxis protein (MCP) signaling protein n=1 Tax=Actinoplanes italicus TaxID=113567 RepID=A0A2T0KCB8_9ACTN|nr:methyl-accepting chemotaxis protein [Actinoplanes italicus]PRX20899.1 methyl-accepting chemotaxis protein (MCP) signaling protein [Actinoplanes italicus]
MMAGRTYGGKLAVGVAITVLLTLLTIAISVAGLAVVVSAKDSAITSATEDLAGAEELSRLMEMRIADYRNYLLDGRPENSRLTEEHHQDFRRKLDELQRGISDTASQEMLTKIRGLNERHAAASAEMMTERAVNNDIVAITRINDTKVVPVRTQLQQALAELIVRVRNDVDRDRQESSTRANQAIGLVIGLGVLTAISAVLVALRLSRDLKREVGAAVGHIQSSSAQLEAAAAQQVNGGRDQASAMSEITTTISELLITSRQIAESAQRVSKIAEETEAAARAGDATIDQTRSSIGTIRSQVDQIVQHMLALGEKSQQIGQVVDLVSELAEQTNILAINATIEASGAGEWGRRFAVVAEEIRKLADRTAASAKEIRTLIEDVRGAVNTTVMATEIGAKAVDAGARKFDDATNSFREIAQLVSTTNDATREIELSTKQQTTAVEQVNVAASDTARVSRETEASAVQTRQTAAHLSTLSSDLLEMVGTGRH